MAEPSELIDPVHGHGGQSMINLFLSGRGVNYVFDNDKYLGGLRKYIKNLVMMISIHSFLCTKPNLTIY